MPARPARTSQLGAFNKANLLDAPRVIGRLRQKYKTMTQICYLGKGVFTGRLPELVLSEFSTDFLGVNFAECLPYCAAGGAPSPPSVIIGLVRIAPPSRSQPARQSPDTLPHPSKQTTFFLKTQEPTQKKVAACVTCRGVPCVFSKKGYLLEKEGVLGRGVRPPIHPDPQTLLWHTL